MTLKVPLMTRSIDPMQGTEASLQREIEALRQQLHESEQHVANAMEQHFKKGSYIATLGATIGGITGTSISYSTCLGSGIIGAGAMGTIAGGGGSIAGYWLCQYCKKKSVSQDDQVVGKYSNGD